MGGEINQKGKETLITEREEPAILEENIDVLWELFLDLIWDVKTRVSREEFIEVVEE